jgi:DNA-binding transcriptional MerR regulator
MENSPEAFRTIREVAEAMELPQHVLRFWETRFPQIRPLKRAGGRRYYRPDDVERLKLIKRLLYDEGYTIKGVQKLFKEQGVHNLATAAFDARLPFGPAEERAPDGPEEDPQLAPGAAAEPEPPPAPRPTAAELAELRNVLAEIREAQRILAQARPQLD